MIFKILLPFLFLLALCGCGTTPIVTSELTFAEEPAEEPAPRTFLVSGGVVTNFLFTAGPGYNGVVPPVTEVSALAGNLTNQSPDSNQFTLSLSETTSAGQAVTVRELNWGILALSSPLEVGQTFNLIVNPGDAGCFLTLSDITTQAGIATTNQAWIANATSSGTITITALADDQVEIDFSFQDVQPDASAGNAQGTFSVSGHVLANLSEVVP